MSQAAIILQEPRAPVVLENRPIPEPTADKLLIKVTAASLNPHDAKVRDMGLFFTGTPVVLAADLAGEIVKIGPGPYSAQYTVGEHVFAQSSPDGPNKAVSLDEGGLQEYTIVNARHAAKVKETGLTDDEAVTLPVSFAAIWVALYHETGLGFPSPFDKDAPAFDFPSKSLLVVGAGSNTGKMAIQFAKISGFGNIIAVAGKSNQDTLVEMGATHFIDRALDDVVDRIRAVAGDDLIYAIDTVNFGDTQLVPGVAALSNTKKGTLVTLLPTPAGVPPGVQVTSSTLGPKSAGYERRQVYGSSSEHSDFTAEFWKRSAGWVKSGHVRPAKYEVIGKLDANSVNAALDRYTAGKMGANKPVIHPQQ